MKGLIQRVKRASVTIDGKLHSEIRHGILVLLGVEKGDNEQNADKLADKLLKLRIFEDKNGKMNKSVKDVDGEILVVSQFTLAGDCKKGTRPSFDKAEHPQRANELYEYFTGVIRQNGINALTGVFGAMMDVELINDGPVTFMLEF
ncbi:MAG: D-aminoacyl-tRNA deacylase [Candidatus Gastranaerophilales bacterium]|nr:D-aminoacyl-tRNA deacylase [Candidatus Gastranaerophilales bacterium]